MSSATAEFFADIALCPLEAARIRLVAQPGYATGALGALARLLHEEGAARGLYAGFGPMLFKQVGSTMSWDLLCFCCVACESDACKDVSGRYHIPCPQIPYTVAKFVVFEHIARGLHAHAAGLGASHAWPSSGDTPSAHRAAANAPALSPFAAAAVNLGAGLVAGCVAALVSQPADTLLSRINRAKAAPGALLKTSKPEEEALAFKCCN